MWHNFRIALSETLGYIIGALALLVALYAAWPSSDRTANNDGKYNDSYPVKKGKAKWIILICSGFILALLIVNSYSINHEPVDPGSTPIVSTEEPLSDTPTPSIPPETSPPPTTLPPSPTQCPEVGDTISFGSYQQEYYSVEKEPIKWLVLDKKDDSLLIISKCGLDCMAYNDDSTDAIWEHSSVRRWLNRVFLLDAFSEEERAQILDTTVTADSNPDYNSYQGNNTTDKVFLLSAREALHYFSSDSDRQCRPTDYAQKKANYEVPHAYCWWWLRTVGETQDKITLVTARKGDLEMKGDGVIFVAGTVRPAMWIKCSR